MKTHHKALLVDKFPAVILAELEALGLQVLAPEKVDATTLPQHLAGVSILLVRSTKVTAESIRAGKNLQLIIRAGAGVDNIDLPAAAEMGIFVANCPGKNAQAVAELAIGLLIAADRRIPAATAELRSGTWDKKKYSKAAGLFGRTLGVVGVGSIGREVIARARALGMRVIAYSRSLSQEQAEALGVERATDLLHLARESDAVTLHVSSNPQSKRLINAAFLAALRPGAILVNTARGDVVDLAALEQAVRDRQIRPALDVFEGEPAAGTAPFVLPLKDLPEFIGTPHIGASTDQAQEAIAAEALRLVKEFLALGQVSHCVNLAEHTPAKFMLVVRHFDRVGVLAGIFDQIRRAEINVQNTKNTVFSGAKAAVARIELDAAPAPEILHGIRSQTHVLSADLVPID